MPQTSPMHGEGERPLDPFEHGTIEAAERKRICRCTLRLHWLCSRIALLLSMQSEVRGRSKRVEFGRAFSTSQGHIGLNACKKEGNTASSLKTTETDAGRSDPDMA